MVDEDELLHDEHPGDAQRQHYVGVSKLSVRYLPVQVAENSSADELGAQLTGAPGPLDNDGLMAVDVDLVPALDG